MGVSIEQGGCRYIITLCLCIAEKGHHTANGNWGCKWRRYTGRWHVPERHVKEKPILSVVSLWLIQQIYTASKSAAITTE